MKRLFISRKYIWAESLSEAIKKEKTMPPDECWLHDKWVDVEIDREEESQNNKIKICQHKSD